MQLLLPLFTTDITLITPTIGVAEHDGFVYYLQNGVPINTHHKDDIKGFRYITSMLIDLGRCSQADIVRAFHVSTDSVSRALKRYRQKSQTGMFEEKDKRHGVSHKLFGERLERIQKMLDKGMSNYSIAKKEQITEGAIRYAIKMGKLKKILQSIDELSGTNRTERSLQDGLAATGMGVAAINTEERILASTGAIQQTATIFEHHNSVMNAGVLIALPALISHGLLKAGEIYKPLPKGYYGFIHILLLLAYMALSRIKNPEQLKRCPPGELGKIIGIDRVPEVKCLREKLSQIVSQKRAEEFERFLSEQWISQQECLYFYIDGHVRVYNGYKANLAKKYVSRQKLCLAGTTEYWVNDEKGLPFMVFTGELNERLKDALEQYIIPALIEDTKSLIDEEQLKNNPLLPRFSLIFDREAYEPDFFLRLWNKFRIAVITYRKNVKDLWDERCFYKIEAEVIGKNVSMLICEKQIELSGHTFREIRKLGEGGHQTSIITTNHIISLLNKY